MLDRRRWLGVRGVVGQKGRTYQRNIDTYVITNEMGMGVVRWVGGRGSGGPKGRTYQRHIDTYVIANAMGMRADI